MSSGSSLWRIFGRSKSKKGGTPATENGGDPGEGHPVMSKMPVCVMRASMTADDASQPQNSSIAPVDPQASERAKLSTGPGSSAPETASTRTDILVQTITPAPSLPEQLWDRAYGGLKADELSLVEAYEKILSRNLNENDSTSDGPESPNTIKQADPTARREQMHQLVQAGLKKTEREARIMHGIGEAMRPVLSVKSNIDSAIHAAPQTALPWAGVCIALQVCRR